MENRFMPSTSVRRAPMRPARAAQPMSRAKSVYSRAQSAEQRALVILIENGGIDLGIPAFVDKVLDVLPGTSMLPSGVKQKLITFVTDKQNSLTDLVIESADLALNRYGNAKPGLFKDVTVLRNSTATYDDLKNTLINFSKEGRIIDLFILTHGSKDEIAVGGGVTGAKIRQMRADYGKPLSIRCVYMMNCVGSSLNQAWLDAGAKTSAGSLNNNYLPEPTNYFFWQNWKAGQAFETAVNSAYHKTIKLMNEAVNDFITGLSPIAGALVDVDFAEMDFVKDSSPVISGQRTVTISTDDLSFAKSLSGSLATTVLPMSVLRSLANGHGTGAKVAYSHSSSYRSSSPVLRQPGEISRQKALPVIAGIAVADAIQIGLGAAAIVQSQANSSSGGFSLVFDTAQRLLTSEGRRDMPGARAATQKYTCPLLYMGAHNFLMDLAKANIIIVWEGNAYGEIGTPVIRRELHSSTEWSKSTASVNIKKIDRIPAAGTDPREWPIVYSYEGSYDPVGNGHFEFSGEFEVNAFGGLHFSRHDVASRSLIDAVIPDGDQFVKKGNDVVVATPPLPAEQLEYLKKHPMP